MATTSISRTAPAPARRPFVPSALLAGAPIAAVLAGLGAEFLDFRELRALFLLGVGFGVLSTSYALTGARPGWRTLGIAAAVGIAAWGGGEAMYTIVHASRGELFHADRFGSQPMQALGLIAAHGLFLGLPTGLTAGAMLHAPWLRARLRDRREGARAAEA